MMFASKGAPLRVRRTSGGYGVIRPQHNPPNPILVAFRMRPDARDIPARRRWRNYLREGWDGSICEATLEQEAHASRVFERWDEVARHHAIDELFDREEYMTD